MSYKYAFQSLALKDIYVVVLFVEYVLEIAFVI